MFFFLSVYRNLGSIKQEREIEREGGRIEEEKEKKNEMNRSESTRNYWMEIRNK